MTLTLRPYQRAAHDAVLDALAFDGYRRMVVSLPTGGGKTLLAAALTETLIERPGRFTPHPGTGRALFLAERSKLLEQAYGSYVAWCPDWARQRGFIQAARHQPKARLLFASKDSLIQPQRLKQVQAAGPFDVIVVDEAHHAVADTYRTLLGTVKDPGAGALIGPRTILLGLTATPSRADQRSLGIVFEELVYSIGLLDLVTSDPPYLCDLRRVSVLLPDVQLGRLTGADAEGDFDLEELTRASAKAIATHSKHRRALEAVLRYAPDDHQGLYFGLNKADAYGFMEYANTSGRCPTAVVTGETPEEERNQLYAQFDRGELRCLANVDVLGEGWDNWRVRWILMGRPTRHAGRYLQAIGRGTRPEDAQLPYAEWAKQDCLIIDLEPNDHTAMTLYSLLGTTEERMGGKRVRELVSEPDSDVALERRTPRIPTYQPGTSLRLTATSLYTSRHWQLTAGGDYQLVTPQDGTYLARRQFGDAYDVVWYGPEGSIKEVSRPGKLEHVMGKAEDHLGRSEVRRARRTDPATRRLLCSQEEMRALHKAWPSLYQIGQKDGAPWIEPVTIGRMQDQWDELAAAGSVSAWWQAHGSRFGRRPRSGPRRS